MIFVREFLQDIAKDQLIDLVEGYAKNIMAMDGVWFQATEKSFGMDQAMEQDALAWRGFAPAEVCRLKKMLGLPERPGLGAWSKCCAWRFTLS